MANSDTSNFFSSSLSQSVTQFQVVTILSFCMISKTILFAPRVSNLVFLEENLLNFISLIQETIIRFTSSTANFLRKSAR